MARKFFDIFNFFVNTYEPQSGDHLSSGTT